MQAQSTLEGSRQGILILAALAAANILALTRGPQEIYLYLWSIGYLWPDLVSIKMIPLYNCLIAKSALIVGRYLHYPEIKRLMVWINWLHNWGDERRLTANQIRAFDMLTNQVGCETISICYLMKYSLREVSLRFDNQCITLFSNDTAYKSINMDCCDASTCLSVWPASKFHFCLLEFEIHQKFESLSETGRGQSDRDWW